MVLSKFLYPIIKHNLTHLQYMLTLDQSSVKHFLHFLRRLRLLFDMILNHSLIILLNSLVRVQIDHARFSVNYAPNLPTNY